LLDQLDAKIMIYW